jgi:hypothetical protein
LPKAYKKYIFYNLKIQYPEKAMKTIEIRKSEEKKSYLKKINQIKVIGLDTKKYLGKIKISEKPLHIQKRLRDEWELIL